MKTGKIAGKLRDEVPICFMVEGKEVKPIDTAALITPPTAEETAPEAEPETEKTGDEEAGSMEIH